MRLIWGLLLATVLALPGQAQERKFFQGISVAGIAVSDEVDFSIDDAESLIGDAAGMGQAVQIKPDGLAYGGWIGYRHQFDNNLVLGLVLRAKDSGADEEVPGAQPVGVDEAGNPVFDPSPLGLSLDVLTGAGLDFSQPFDIRARVGRTFGVGFQIGYAIDFIMPFVEVGFSNANLKLLAGEQTLVNDEMNGLRLGGGAAWRFGDKLSLQVSAFLTQFDEPTGFSDNRFVDVDRVEFGGGVVYTF